MEKKTKCPRCGKTLVNSIGKISLVYTLECVSEHCNWALYTDDWAADYYEWDESKRLGTGV